MKIKLPFRISLLLAIVLLVSLQTVHANPITRQQALENANEFLQKRGINVKNVTMRQVPAFKASETAENAPYYVFNIGDDDGFVIASGDDCAYEILGYSDKGHFDADNVPDGMKYMLDFYAEQIGSGSKSSHVAEPKSSPTYLAVEPMLTSEWGQNWPYNNNCPIDESTGKRSVTGCVATAMAQVMYYHRHHQSVSEVLEDIPAYTAFGNDFDGVPGGSPIDWDNMLDSYDDNATAVQEQAVANLMLYCGTSVEMDYHSSSSGTYSSNVAPALIKYFDYYDEMQMKSRYKYSNTEWETMVYEELEKGNPVFYSGTAPIGGHAFVVDGHDGNGFVHINWGWNGTLNGDFRLTPTYAGEESMGEFSSYQSAIFGAMPNASIPRLTTTDLYLTCDNLVENISSLETIPVSFVMTIANLTEETRSFEQAVGLYKLGELQSIISPVSTYDEMAPGASHFESVSLEVESTLAPGLYTIVPINRRSSSDQWRRNNNYELFVTMSIYGGKAHLSVGEPEQEGDIITFACDLVRGKCIYNWDFNGDGAFSKEEAAAVTSLDGIFKDEYNITSFDELQYFTGLTAIAQQEFENCMKLESVKFPPQLQSIGIRAFSNCRMLQQIIIPQSVTSIGKFAFSSNWELKEIRVENGNPVYDSRSNCNAIIETATNRLIVGGCCSEIPDGVVAIGQAAFESCYGLEHIQIPESVTSIEDNAFNHCSSLTTVNMGGHVTEIGKSAFSSCSALIEITIPSTVTSVGDYAFSSCSGLTTVNFLPGMTSISNSMFSSCKGLTSFTIPSTVTCIGNNAFYGCSGLTSFMIPPSVAHIGSGAFASCTGLASVTIPNSVTAIDGNPFYGCTNLSSIVVDTGNPCYHSYGGNTAIIETATKTLITGCANTVMPNDLLAIGAYAFYYCSGLTSVVIPEGVTSIGEYAFSRTGLTALTLPESVTSIDRCAFSWCSNLGSINIPTGVTSISDCILQYCSSLQSIYIPEGVTSIGSSAFYGCSALTEISLPSTITSIGDYAFSGCTGLTIIEMPDDVTSIGNNAFAGCSNLEHINIPSKLTSITERVFQNCSNLQSISMPLGVTSIGTSAFYGCKAFTAINIPSTVTCIGNSAFTGCSSLTSIKSYVTDVFETGTRPFYNCNLATLYVPQGLVDVYRSTPDWNTIDFIEEMPVISDVNYDGSTNIADVACIIDRLLGLIDEACGYFDVNNDEHVSIADVTTLIDILLARSIRKTDNSNN